MHNYINCLNKYFLFFIKQNSAYYLFFILKYFIDYKITWWLWASREGNKNKINKVQ